MISVFWKAIANLSDPVVRRTFGVSVLATVLTYCLLFGLVTWGLSSSTLTTVPWMDTVIDVLGGLAVAVLAWILFPGTVSAFVGLFLDSVANAVERRDYATLPPARETPVLEAVLGGLKFVAVTIGLNLLALPLYLIPVVNLFVFAVLNGYLISREYFELAALRRLPPLEVSALRRKHRSLLWGTGIVLTGLLMVPGLNLIAPIIGVAVMVHLVQRLTRRTTAP